jgi:hypothetical protein
MLTCYTGVLSSDDIAALDEFVRGFVAIMYHLMALRGSRGRETVRRPTSFVAWLGRYLGGQRPGS